MLNLFDYFSNFIDDAAKSRKYFLSHNVFTRNRKLPFHDIVNHIVFSPRHSIANSLSHYFSNLNSIPPSKQAFSDARQNISSDFFLDCNFDIIKKLYSNPNSNLLTFKKFFLFAIDATSLTVSKNLMGFCKSNNYTRKDAIMKSSAVIDVLNNYCLDFIPMPFTTSDMAFVIQHVKNIKKLLPHNAKFIIIMDRGYCSKKLFNFFNKERICFITRSKDSIYKNLFIDNDNFFFDDNNDFLRYSKVKIFSPKDGYKTERLVSNLTKSFSRNVLKKLYGLRWNIETAYHNLKIKMRIEIFSSTNHDTTLQDIYSQIIFYNICMSYQDLSNKNISNNPKNKRKYKINLNYLIGEIRKRFSILFNSLKKNIKSIVKNLVRDSTRNKISIIHGRHVERKTNNDRYKRGKFITTNIKPSS